MLVVFDYRHSLCLLVLHFNILAAEAAMAEQIQGGDFGYPCTISTKCVHACNGVKFQPLYSFHSEETAKLSIHTVVAKRFNDRWGVGVIVPWVMTSKSRNGQKGFGDIVLLFKRVLYVDKNRRFLFASGLLVSPPTGEKSKGLSKGFTNLQPYFVFGKAFGGFKTAAELAINIPSDPNKGDLTYACNAAFILDSNQPSKKNILMVEIEWSIQKDGLSGGSELFVTPVLLRKIEVVPKLRVAVGIKCPLIENTHSGLALIGYVIREF